EHPEFQCGFGFANPKTTRRGERSGRRSRRRYSGFTDPFPEEDQMSTSTDRRVMQPDAKHPITIEPNPGRVTVTVGGKVVADSSRTLTLREADYAPVSYFPPEDVDFEQLAATEHSSYCPYKGEANYYIVPAGGARSRDAVWQYREAYPAVAEISDHLAFYPDRVDSID